LEAVISNAAEASGVVVPTPICAKALKLITAKAAVNIILLIVFIFFVLKVKVLVAEIAHELASLVQHFVVLSAEALHRI